MITLSKEEINTGLISKKNFCKVINELKNVNDLNIKMFDLWRNTPLFDNPPEVVDYSDNVIDLLSTMFRDLGETILYFCYELNFGEDYEEGYITEADGTIIDISTPEKLYDYLLSEMEKNHDSSNN